MCFNAAFDRCPTIIDSLNANKVVAIHVYNPLAWQRDVYVSVLTPVNAFVQDAREQYVDSQTTVISTNPPTFEITWRATDVLPLSFNVYTITKATVSNSTTSTSAPATQPRVAPNLVSILDPSADNSTPALFRFVLSPFCAVTIKNEFVSVVFSPAGTLVSITDLVSGTQLLIKSSVLYYNSASNHSDAWFALCLCSVSLPLSVCSRVHLCVVV